MSNNNNKTEISANTNGLQFYNNTKLSTLVTSYWNDKIQLKINPGLPPEKRTETKFYDYDNFLRVTLTSNAVNTLIMAIERTDIVNKVRHGNIKDIKYPIGIPAGSGFIEIGTGYHYNIKNPDCMVLRIYDGVDEKCKTETYLTYIFEKSVYFSNYNNNLGTYDNELVDSSFEEFITQLYSYKKSVSRAYSHSIREADRWYRDKDINNISEIMSKLGISFNNGKNNNNSGFYNNNKPTNQNYDNSVKQERLSIEDDEDLPF